MTSYSYQQKYTVGPTFNERQCGHPPWKSDSSSFKHAMQVFQTSGFCVVPDCLPRNFAQQCHSLATDDYHYLNEQLEQKRRNCRDHHLAVAVTRCDFAEIKARDGGRCDIRFNTNEFPYTAPGLVYNPIVFPLVKELLHGSVGSVGSANTKTSPDSYTQHQEGIQLLYAGVMWAAASNISGSGSGSDTAPQRWHADGGHCFDFPDAPHLPPHCINVFYPLIDLETKHGPTEFLPGTHIIGKFNDHDANAKGIGLTCQLGGCVMFDYRVKHRGGHNTSNEMRPVLYLCYAKNWFIDRGNERSARSVVDQRNVKPWRSRILKGEAMPMGKGFSNVKQRTTEKKEETTAATANVATEANVVTEVGNVGSGERWVLLHMDIDLGSETDTIVVYSDDVALEVASQFCLKKELDDSVIPVLQEQIQMQMDAALV